MPAPAAAEVTRALRATYAHWEGTPYEWGGLSASGIDCSGFALVLYRDALQRTLPRTTRRQARKGRSVPLHAAQPGDLIFFLPALKARHVGVYLQDGRFIHASTSAGVTISNLNASYWQDRYWMTRRLLPDLSPPPSRAASSAPGAASRTGW